MAFGFTAPPAATRSTVVDNYGTNAVTTQAPKSTTSLQLTSLLFAPEILPVLIVITGAVATVITTERLDDVPVEYSPPPVPEPEPAPEPVPEPVPEPEPAPVEAVEETVETVDTSSEAEEESSSTEARVEEEPVAAPASSSGESIAELRRGVAKTLDENSSVPQTQLLKRSTPVSEASTEVTEDASGSGEKKRGLIRKTFRVVKKIIMPWRKWKNIS